MKLAMPPCLNKSASQEAVTAALRLEDEFCQGGLQTQPQPATIYL